MNKVFEIWGHLPTTAARITVTLLAVLATTIRYVTSHEHVLANGSVTAYWEPSYSWLGFLIVMSGLDAASWLSKRMTDSSYVAAKAGTPPPEA